jgi:glycosyltransferase involved in cell wall biosynthesis
MLSILTPAFNEAANLEALHARLVATMSTLALEWEWLVVDDHSRDGTLGALARIADRDPRVRGIRLARNSGSHVAIQCGLHHVSGDAAVMLAADLQDPPETLGAMLDRWRDGAHVVWATRRVRPGDSAHAGFAALYYWIMRRVVGMTEMPATGADFFLVDRVVIDAFRAMRERNVSVLALITSMGFRQDSIEYDKQPRAAGRSGWTLQKKIALVVDSVVGFSEAPIRACGALGLLLGGVGLVTAVGGLWFVPRLWGFAGLLMGLIFALSGVQLLALSMLGAYVWRTLDEARGRPPYLIEARVGPIAPVRPSATGP